MLTCPQLSQILNFRNAEQALKASQTASEMLRALTDMGISAKNESESLRSLSERAVKDSRFMKILTFAALLYLPASLIAVSALYYHKIKRKTDILQTIDHLQLQLDTNCGHWNANKREQICSYHSILVVSGARTDADCSHCHSCCYYRKIAKKDETVRLG